MKKYTKILAVAIAAIMTIGSISFVSCNKNDESPIPSHDNPPCETKALSLTDAQREAIAQQFALSMVSFSNSYEELYRAISVVRSYGLDEQIYVYDILHTNYSVFLPPTQPLDYLRPAIVASHLIESCGVANSPYCGQLQLYWPYHDNWDHVTTPTIIFEPTSEAIATVHGYRIVGGVAQSVDLKVSSLDDSTQGTFVIIKEAEFNYTIYPDFKNGVYTKNGITWLRPTNVVGQDGTLSYEDQTTVGDTIYEASAYKFKCLTGQHDSWFFGGGSEFAVTIARLLPDGTTDTHTYSFELTRQEIKNQTEKMLNNPLYLHTNWQPSNDYVHYRYFERDGGGSENQYTVNFTYQGATVSATIKTKSSDDYFGSGNMYRYQYFNWCQTGNNVNGLGNSDQFWFKIRAYSI